MSKASNILSNYEEFKQAITNGESAVGLNAAGGQYLPLGSLLAHRCHLEGAAKRISTASLMKPPAPKLIGIPAWKNCLFLISQVFPALLAHSYAQTVPEIRKTHELNNKALAIFLLLLGIVPYVLYVAQPLYMMIPGVRTWLLRPRKFEYSEKWCACSMCVECLDQGLAIFKPAPPAPPSAALREAESHIELLRNQAQHNTQHSLPNTERAV